MKTKCLKQLFQIRKVLPPTKCSRAVHTTIVQIFVTLLGKTIFCELDVYVHQKDVQDQRTMVWVFSPYICPFNNSKNTNVTYYMPCARIVKPTVNKGGYKECIYSHRPSEEPTVCQVA